MHFDKTATTTTTTTTTTAQIECETENRRSLSSLNRINSSKNSFSSSENLKQNTSKCVKKKSNSKFKVSPQDDKLIIKNDDSDCDNTGKLVFPT